jgi:hypothetical protein
MIRRSPVFWTLLVLVVMFINPPTRKWVVAILPTGRNLDDILFWIVLALFGIYLFMRKVVGPRREKKKRKFQDQQRLRLLEYRIDYLLDHILQWVGSAPEKSLLYLYYQTPKALENAEHASDIWAEAQTSARALEDVTDASQRKAKLEQIYIALVGSPPPQITWFNLLEKLDSVNVEGGDVEPEAARQLSLTRSHPLGNWRLDDILLDSSQYPPVKGALSYILDPANAAN